MHIVRTVDELRSALRSRRERGNSIGFIPTMGALHRGHTSLMSEARRRCDVVVASIFVNPAQFPDPAGYDRYPRNEEEDARLAESEGVDLLFTPPVAEIYPDGFATAVTVRGELAGTLHDTRLAEDGQLSGMCTIIVKLLNIVQPTVVFFGEKDLPHWIAVARMARDLNVPAEIAVLPTVRDTDGLPLSSRNVQLGDHRQRAACLPRALRAALDVVDSGAGTPLEAKNRAREELDVEYVEILNIETLRSATDLSAPSIIAIGARVGGVALLDIARSAAAISAPETTHG